MKFVLLLSASALLCSQALASMDHDQAYLRQLPRPSPLRTGGTGLSGRGIVEAERHSFPFTLSLQAVVEFRLEHMCSAILINESTALAPASCVLLLIGLQKLIFAGSHHLSIPEERRQVREVRNYTVHPGLKLGRFPKYDIAVLSLNASFELTDFVKTAPVFNADPVAPKDCAVSGWYNWPPPPAGDVLQMANVTLLGRTACEELLNGWGYPLQETTTCAGVDGGSEGWADHGGPLVCDNKLIGMTGDPILWRDQRSAPIMLYNVSYIAAWVDSFQTPVPISKPLSWIQ